MNLQENIHRIKEMMGLEEIYSPADKKHTPSQLVFHKSNPMNRDNIMKTGLQVSVGDCYKSYVGGEEECRPAIFATDTKSKNDLFDSTWDDDIWSIDTDIAKVNWFKDKHFKKKKHIVTFENIIPDSLKLIYKGTGKSL
jgi:hypothetical protein